MEDKQTQQGETVPHFVTGEANTLEGAVTTTGSTVGLDSVVVHLNGTGDDIVGIEHQYNEPQDPLSNFAPNASIAPLQSNITVEVETGSLDNKCCDNGNLGQPHDCLKKPGLPIQSDNIENPQNIPQVINCRCHCHLSDKNLHISGTYYQNDKGQNEAVAIDSCSVKQCEHCQPISPENNKEEKPKDLGGRPCLYCENKDKYQKIADEYIAWSLVEQGDKRRIPYTEELAIKLGHHRESIMNWANNKDEHPQFFDTIKILQTIQALRLQQRTMGRYNPGGAIFLLKANHGYMESEKKIFAGDRTEPLTIEIIEEDK